MTKGFDVKRNLILAAVILLGVIASGVYVISWHQTETDKQAAAMRYDPKSVKYDNRGF